MYGKIIYVAGKFQNKKENKEYIEECCRRFTKIYPSYLFINGVSQFSHCYSCTSQRDGLRMCISLMKMCTEIWTVGEYENSVGTYVEMMCAETLGKKIVEHADKTLLKSPTDKKEVKE